MQFLRGFYAGTIDLGRVNRSYMVLLPKKPGAFTVDAFRPICLQNCSVKIGAKILTTRLQREITGLIDLDQTGFLKGRTIAENFVYAGSCCRCATSGKCPHWFLSSTSQKLLILSTGTVSLRSWRFVALMLAGAPGCGVYYKHHALLC